MNDNEQTLREGQALLPGDHRLDQIQSSEIPIHQNPLVGGNPQSGGVGINYLPLNDIPCNANELWVYNTGSLQQELYDTIDWKLLDVDRDSELEEQMCLQAEWDSLSESHDEQHAAMSHSSGPDNVENDMDEVHNRAMVDLIGIHPNPGPPRRTTLTTWKFSEDINRPQLIDDTPPVNHAHVELEEEKVLPDHPTPPVLNPAPVLEGITPRRDSPHKPIKDKRQRVRRPRNARNNALVGQQLNNFCDYLAGQADAVQEHQAPAAPPAPKTSAQILEDRKADLDLRNFEHTTYIRDHHYDCVNDPDLYCHPLTYTFVQDAPKHLVWSECIISWMLALLGPFALCVLGFALVDDASLRLLWTIFDDVIIMLFTFILTFLLRALVHVHFRHMTRTEIFEIVGHVGPEDNRGVGATTYISEYINGVQQPAINNVHIVDMIQYLPAFHSGSDGWRDITDHATCGVMSLYCIVAGLCDHSNTYFHGTRISLNVNMAVVQELVLRESSVTTDIYDRCLERVPRMPSVNRQNEMSAEVRESLVASYIIRSIQGASKQIQNDPFCVQGWTGASENLSR